MFLWDSEVPPTSSCLEHAVPSTKWEMENFSYKDLISLLKNAVSADSFLPACTNLSKCNCLWSLNIAINYFHTLISHLGCVIVSDCAYALCVTAKNIINMCVYVHLCMHVCVCVWGIEIGISHTSLRQSHSELSTLYVISHSQSFPNEPK